MSKEPIVDEANRDFLRAGLVAGASQTHWVVPEMNLGGLIPKAS